MRAGTDNLFNGYLFDWIQIFLGDRVMHDAGCRRIGCMAIGGVLGLWNVVIDINTAQINIGIFFGLDQTIEL